MSVLAACYDLFHKNKVKGHCYLAAKEERHQTRFVKRQQLEKQARKHPELYETCKTGANLP